MAMTEPLVSCLMVTRNRAHMSLRAVHGFAEQTWPNKELVIVDDGEEDYGPMLAPYLGRATIRYIKLAPDPARTLGAARNISLEEAHGELMVQWDDDEWYHRDRIAIQAKALLSKGLDAVLLRNTLMHIDTPEMRAHPYRQLSASGTPGTIMHRRFAYRYPDLRRGEDTAYLRQIRAEKRVGFIDGPDGHLFIRCFHGQNTWNQEHFAYRLRWKWRDRLHYFWATRVRRDLFSHPAFRLTALERATVADYLRANQVLGLDAPAPARVAGAR